MPAFQIDPLSDPRWEELLSRHPRASVFHSTAWLRSLQDTYGYRSVALTTAEPDKPLRNGLVFCQVNSWLTGSRLVSLPFSDHCEPLLEREEDFAEIWPSVEAHARLRRSRYVELRPLRAMNDLATSCVPHLQASSSFCFHLLGLTPPTEQLYQGLHKSCVRRSIQKAEREGVIVEQGRSEDTLGTFYRLLLLTRRRHQLPPQPLSWFRNLIKHFGPDLVIWIARKDDQPIAAILTLACPQSVVYKYGCSNEEFHHLGGMPALFWKAIQYAKTRNAGVFDFGRSDADNEGLITFKDRMGAERVALTYFRSMYRPASQAKPPGKSPLAGGFSKKLAKTVMSHLPDFCLTTAGRLLYRHMA